MSSELKENMLISCDDLRKLRVIPADFPNAVLAVQQSNKLSHLKAKLMQRFDSSDDLNPEPMRCPPMSIALQEHATPTCVTMARHVPKHYEPESKRTVTELIDKGVITPVNKATTLSLIHI